MKKQNNDVVLDYFEEIKIRPAKNRQQFMNMIAEKYGKTIASEIDKIISDRDDGEYADGLLYEVKNSNLKLSLDFAAYSSDLYRRFLDQVIQRKSASPRQILDIGCDNGIVTCFLAKLYPDSEVWGIDRSENGIRCATELAEKLKLSNVKFVRTSFENLPVAGMPSTFDLIVSVRSMHEVLGRLPDLGGKRFWSLSEIIEDEQLLDGFEKLQIVRNLLAPISGEFISFERTKDYEMIALWAKLLEINGLFVNWKDSTMVKCFELKDELKLPFLVASSQERGENIFKGMANLWGIGDKVDIGKTYSDLAAELIFHNIDTKKMISGVEINFNDGSGIMRCEVWEHPDWCISYQYSNIGFRELKVYDKAMVKEAVKQLTVAADHYASCAKSRRY